MEAEEQSALDLFLVGEGGLACPVIRGKGRTWIRTPSTPASMKLSAAPQPLLTSSRLWCALSRQPESLCPDRLPGRDTKDAPLPRPTQTRSGDPRDWRPESSLRTPRCPIPRYRAVLTRPAQCQPEGASALVPLPTDIA